MAARAAAEPTASSSVTWQARSDASASVSQRPCSAALITDSTRARGGRLPHGVAKDVLPATCELLAICSVHYLQSERGGTLLSRSSIVKFDHDSSPLSPYPPSSPHPLY